MDVKTSIKKKLPSRHVTEGPERAPHRSYLYAMGLTTEQIHQPFVGVASCWNEAAPCNISLMRQAQAVKKGVAAVARMHCGLGRIDRARPCLRCAGRPCRMRQIAAGNDDGDGAAQRALD